MAWKPKLIRYRSRYREYSSDTDAKKAKKNGVEKQQSQNKSYRATKRFRKLPVKVSIEGKSLKYVILCINLGRLVSEDRMRDEGISGRIRTTNTNIRIL